MSVNEFLTPDTSLIAHFIQNAPHMMWFLGAGTSRTAGMPTATDIIWDLKRQHYCLMENQNIQNHDINNESIKRKIQNYMDSKNYPSLWSADEYSFYFNLLFKEDYAAQQKYLQNQLNTEKISLSIGHRALVALLKMDKSRLVFTTNFDDVIEQAYASVAGDNLTAYHLEGSYAALEALNSENFPIYAKIHGDFRYQSIKNLPDDLLSNDEQIQKCFLAAATRYGVIISGYSGRDANVMSMFNRALEQNNAFPHGIYWAVTRISDVPDSVLEFIQKARDKNVAAYIVDTGTFDILLSKIWRQINDKADILDKKVRTAISQSVSIPLPKPSEKGYPILRTNALLVTEAPSACAVVDTAENISFKELNEAIREAQGKVLSVKTNKIMAWGSKKEIVGVLSKFHPSDPVLHTIEEPIKEIKDNTIIRSFFEEALVNALVSGKPLLIRKNRKQLYAVVDHQHINNPIFQSLKKATGYKDSLGSICGSFQRDTFWAEAVSIKLEERNGNLWVLLRPDIWVKPLQDRQNYREQIKERKRYRYNQKASDFLNAWISILLGEIGGNDITIEHFSDAEFPIKFTVNSRSAFSRKES